MELAGLHDCSSKYLKSVKFWLTENSTVTGETDRKNVIFYGKQHCENKPKYNHYHLYVSPKYYFQQVS